MKKNDFITIFIICSLFAVGLFHDFVACVAGIALCVYLCIFSIKNKSIKIYANLASIAIMLIVLFYGISTFWAIDGGLATIGFFKFLPLLFILIIGMQSQINVDKLFSIIPLTATVMTVISTVLMQVPVLEKWFSVSGRLAGFFQYSNTFALFLLIALIIIGTKEKLEKFDFLYIPILLFGIIYSGSRTVFVLMIVSIIALILFNSNKKYKIFILGTAIVIVGIALFYAVITDDFDSIGRFLTVSLKESTFVGRLLYFYDALPVILQNPFGLGYMGYHYYQQSIQTGVYTVMYVHNDFLQLLLDIGWIPTVVFICAIIKSFFKKGTSLQKRLLLLVISAHTCFDFNFQFLAIFMIFILLLDYKEGKEITIKTSKIASVTLSIIMVVAFAYISVAQGLSYFNQYSLSNSIYPWNTQNHMMLLKEIEDYNESEELADKIIKNNSYVALAYDIKARNAYSKGDFKSTIEYKEKAIETSPFTYNTYENYCYMLINGIYLYEKNNDTYSADICKKELIATVKLLEENSQRLSELGKMIKDQPKTRLPDKVLKYVEELEYEK